MRPDPNPPRTHAERQPIAPTPTVVIMDISEEEGRLWDELAGLREDTE